jgi:ABC-2 type transport system permease protein
VTLVKVLWILTVRDVIRMWRQRGRMLTSLLAPIVILLVFGAGYGSLLQAGTMYRKFLLAGMVLQAMIFSSNIAGSSLIWDREFGFLRVVALAPVPQRWLALGKIFGAGAQALAHALLFLAAAPLVGVWMTVPEFFASLGIALLLGLGLGGLFLMLASRTRSYEDFNAISLFFSVPMLFMSGAHFPVLELPAWLRTLARLNPVTYGVDALKHLFIEADAAGRWTPDFPMGFDLGVLVAFTLATVGLSVALFRLREE